jgi:hypothetical protein
MKRPTLASLREKCHRWNAEHPRGSFVIFRKANGELVVTATRSRPKVLRGARTTMILLEGVRTHCLLDQVQPLAPSEITATYVIVNRSGRYYTEGTWPTAVHDSRPSVVWPARRTSAALPLSGARQRCQQMHSGRSLGHWSACGGYCPSARTSNTQSQRRTDRKSPTTSSNRSLSHKETAPQSTE